MRKPKCPLELTTPKMKISDVKVIRFKTHADRWDIGHARLKKNAEVIQTITRIETDEGAVGHFFGGGKHGDQDGMSPDEQRLIEGQVRDMILGADPFDRELIWKWMWVRNIPEVAQSVIDCALWDLAANCAGMPLYKFMGGARDKVPAYASTYPNIGQPEVYAEHALACQAEGYQAYKIHPHYFWNPETRTPTNGRPSNIRADIETINLVREAVGPDMVLMYDVWGTYHTMEETIKVGRELERNDFYWYEHPMPEYRVETYRRLCKELSIPILAPEIAAGGVFTRAEWILQGASDMSRMDIRRGGVTGCRKTAIVCEAYGQRCEVHMAGWGNLHVMGATHEDTSEWYEKGLLAPGVDYDAKHPYLKHNCDPMDEQGYVALPQTPGLGYEIIWDHINDNLVKK